MYALVEVHQVLKWRVTLRNNKYTPRISIIHDLFHAARNRVQFQRSFVDPGVDSLAKKNDENAVIPETMINNLVLASSR